MLKTELEHETWLVHQPDHARVSGYLAAHWGNDDGFQRPGFFAPFEHPEKLRQLVVHAIAEHDNGWWEWEASPELDPSDGLPLNLPDVARKNYKAGLERWRNGVPRLSQVHPYEALLVNYHAYLLYAYAFTDLPGLEAALRHPIFGQNGATDRLVADRDLTRAFLDERKQVESDLISQVQADPEMRAALTPEHLFPHIKLLQVMDSLSLQLSYGGKQELILPDVPRGDWNDRVTLNWRPAGELRIACDPFPFDTSPLPVHLPLRRISKDDLATQAGDLVSLHATPLTTVEFEIVA